MQSPRDLGCRCDLCPLQGSTPVYPERRGSSTLILGDHPADAEEAEGRPFVSPSTFELDRALAPLNVRRHSVDWGNMILCRPPENDFDKAKRTARREAKKVERANRKRVAEGLLPLELPLAPEDACRPYFNQLTAGYSNILSLGTYATKNLLQKAEGILGLRGTLQELPNQRILATLHPSHVQRQKRWRSVFHADVAKAFRYFKGQLKWVEPNLFVRPSPAQLRAYLFSDFARNGFTVCDVETAAKTFDNKGNPIFDGMTDILRCIGFCQSDGQHSVVVPWLSVDGITRFYTESEYTELRQITVEFMESEKFLKVGHNAGYYDRLVVESTFFCKIRNLTDTLMLHHCIASEHPHSLGFLASLYTDSPSWKEAHTATQAQSDKELYLYNGRDCAINSRIYAPLVQAASAIRMNERLHPSLRTLHEVEHGMQEVCTGLHRVGLYVDQKAREKHHHTLVEQAAHWKEQAFLALKNAGENPNVFDVQKYEETMLKVEKRRASGKEIEVDEEEFELNMGSRDQIGELFYERWDLPLPSNVHTRDVYTKSGDRSTGDTILRSYVGDPRLKPEQRAFVHALRMYRRQLKILGTYIIPLREAFGMSNCRLSEDNKIHADWKAHGTLVGRLAADNPNVVNIPDTIRNIIAAPPGHVLIDADQDALHLRIIASRWKIPSLQEAFLGTPRFHRGFRMGAHELFAELLFGNDFMNSPHGSWPTENPDNKWKAPAKGLRDTAKTTRYAGAYGASFETIFREITSTEDKKTGKLTFANMELSFVRDLYSKWMDSEPQWKQAWEAEKALWQSQGFIADPVHGRRRYFGDEKETDVVNYPILAIEAALMNEITLDIVKEFPFEFMGKGTGLIHQNYDSVVLCMPGQLHNEGTDKNPIWIGDSRSKKVSLRVQELMTRHLPNMPVGFFGNPEIRPHWA
jgi:DNA polymerase I-like protein with 3'-5' exonuclease and polymerase domains/uracil-DNA glycosylase